jgi:hypothetical protein
VDHYDAPGSGQHLPVTKRPVVGVAGDLLVDGRDGLAELRRPGARATLRRIRLGGRLSDQTTEKALNAAFFSCGCEHGSVAVMLILAGSVAAGLTVGFTAAFTWWRIGIYLAVAAATGKAIGLTIARVRLRAILRRLDRALAAQFSDPRAGISTDADARI